MGFNIFSPRGGDAVVIKELHSRLRKKYIKNGDLVVKTEEIADNIKTEGPETTSSNSISEGISNNSNNFSDKSV